MTPRKLDNTAFDECDHCGGLWLCPVTLATVRTEAEARARLLPSDSDAPAGPGRPKGPGFAYRKCPICRKHMNRSNYAKHSGVIADSCREHGCYFDQGELRLVFDFIESGGLEKMRRREAEERRSAEREARRQAILAGAQGDLVSRRSPLEEPTGLDLLSVLRKLF